ncbi:hypothetical protein BU17DRAFT_36489 [Hysterangium stoloniferum]|nr:hypothetical protein BU17DRAFT_36489 [Hysterangium stoloniferum]
MPWPEHVREQFGTVTAFGEIDETEYYGPYNGLLLHLFPGEEHFMVVPQYKRPTYPQSIDFTTIFIVQHQKHPVLFLEIKPAGHIKKTSNRASADEQMRQRFKDLRDEVSTPTLYGISALGTKLCVYTYKSQSRIVIPPEIKDDPVVLNDTAPANRWDLDVMEFEGEQRIREIVGHIKIMCDGL